MNLRDVASDLKAKRSKYTDGGRTGPGGETELSIDLLNGIEYLGARFDFKISEVAGGVHSDGSKHYFGKAFDVNNVNNIPAKYMSDEDIVSFKEACYAAGADYVQYENTHFHVQFNP